MSNEVSLYAMFLYEENNDYSDCTSNIKTKIVLMLNQELWNNVFSKIDDSSEDFE